MVVVLSMLNEQLTKLLRYEAILDLVSKTSCSTSSGGNLMECGACMASAELGREYQCKGGVVEKE